MLTAALERCLARLERRLARLERLLAEAEDKLAATTELEVSTELSRLLNQTPPEGNPLWHHAVLGAEGRRILGEFDE